MINIENDNIIKASRSGGSGRTCREKRSKKIEKLSDAALDALGEILTNGSAKDADRISAAKLTFDAAARNAQALEAADPVIRVVFDDADREMAE